MTQIEPSTEQIQEMQIKSLEESISQHEQNYKKLKEDYKKMLHARTVAQSQLEAYEQILDKMIETMGEK